MSHLPAIATPTVLNRIRSVIMDELCIAAGHAGRRMRCSLLSISDALVVYVSGVRDPAAPVCPGFSLSLMMCFTPEAWSEFQRAGETVQIRMLESFEASIHVRIRDLLDRHHPHIDLASLTQNLPGPILIELDSFDYPPAQA